MEKFLTILSNLIHQCKVCIIASGVYLRNAMLVLRLKINVIDI